MKTGFINAYCNKTIKKYYSYHGEIRDCLIQPDPDPFEDFPTDVPYGPTQYMLFVNNYISGYYQQDVDYNVAHNAPTGRKYISIVGQDFYAPFHWYSMYRGGIAFDTIALPDNSKIVSGVMTMAIQTYYGYLGWDLVIRNGMPTFPHLYDYLGDYNFAAYSGNGGSTTYPNKSVLNFNVDGVKWINKFGITKFGLFSSRDIAGVWPTRMEAVYYKHMVGVHKLEVGYKLPL